MTATRTYTTVIQEPGQAQIVLRGARTSRSSLQLYQDTKSLDSIARKTEKIPLFTWTQLQDIVSTGNLQKLSRHPDDLRDYLTWMEMIRKNYGSVHEYILAEKLTASKLVIATSQTSTTSSQEDVHFSSWFMPGHDCQILVNDWPYSVPLDVTHHVVWSHLPILHPDLVPSHRFPDLKTRREAWSIISRRGLCGSLSSGGVLKVPSIADHLIHLPSTTLSLSQRQSVQDAILSASSHLTLFIQQHWDLSAHEAVFFANPPSLQSVPSLAHFHVLIKATS